MSAALRERIAGLLAEHHVMTVATRGASGLWAAAVFYVADGLILYFLSSARSRHGLNLAEDPRAAVTIQHDYDDWPAIRGLQMEGSVSLLAGAEVDRARRLYGERYPLIGKLAQAPAAIVQALAKVSWYRFTPRRIVVVDNTLGFGHRDTLELEA
jgi:hypothetical protein